MCLVLVCSTAYAVFIPVLPLETTSLLNSLIAQNDKAPFMPLFLLWDICMFCLVLKRCCVGMVDVILFKLLKGKNKNTPHMQFIHCILFFVNGHPHFYPTLQTLACNAEIFSSFTEKFHDLITFRGWWSYETTKRSSSKCCILEVFGWLKFFPALLCSVCLIISQ